MTCARCLGLLVVSVPCGCGGYAAECECGGDGSVVRECPDCMAPAPAPLALGGELAASDVEGGGDDVEDCF